MLTIVYPIHKVFGNYGIVFVSENINQRVNFSSCVFFNGCLSKGREGGDFASYLGTEQTFLFP